ncbi:MAG TPA: DUF3373 domain-containing protein [Geobacteraceae bacterium]|nr:DUF3373 domain-containing protein [Geobacteraceae bacterium]
MTRTGKKLLTGTLLLALTLPVSALAADQDVNQKIDALQKELDALKKKTEQVEQKTDQVERKSLGRWLEIGGDYRFRYDYLNGSVANFYNPTFNASGQVNGFNFNPAFDVKNDSLFTNRFGLNLKAKATKDVTVTARLLMYKVSGEQDDAAVNGTGGSGVGPFFADRAGLFDGTIGHVPGDSRLAVDRVYATWNNIADQPIWFSVGRRPSTGGVPSELRDNREKPGNSGVPALLVDYAFDGVTLGYAPDIDALPGSYLKLCYGRGFENGITTDSGNGLRDTDMFGINVVPYDTDAFRAEFQYNRGMNIFNVPVFVTGPNLNTPFASPSVNVGDIDWFGLDFLGKVKNVGIGHINWFVDGALSVTRPNNNTVILPVDPAAFGGATSAPFAGLLYNPQTETRKDKTGWAIYLGGRYDIEDTGTKLGVEYNHGSKDWITFAPAADDMWTSKVGTRGNVYEGYVIQELKLKPISSYTSKVFFRVGYQYYDFDYTGSNNWIGAPVKISELALSPLNAQMLTPLKTAQNVYATFEVHF